MKNALTVSVSVSDFFLRRSRFKETQTKKSKSMIKPALAAKAAFDFFRLFAR
jgi:hypothetical protein